MEDEGCFLLSLCPRGTWSVTFQVGIGLQVCLCGELYVNYLSGESEWVDLGCDSLWR